MSEIVTMKMRIWGKDPDRAGNIIASPIPDDGTLFTLPQTKIRLRLLTPWGHVAVVSVPLKLVIEGKGEEKVETAGIDKVTL